MRRFNTNFQTCNKLLSDTQEKYENKQRHTMGPQKKKSDEKLNFHIKCKKRGKEGDKSIDTGFQNADTNFK